MSNSTNSKNSIKLNMSGLGIVYVKRTATYERNIAKGGAFENCVISGRSMENARYMMQFHNSGYFVSADTEIPECYDQGCFPIHEKYIHRVPKEFIIDTHKQRETPAAVDHSLSNDIIKAFVTNRDTSYQGNLLEFVAHVAFCLRTGNPMGEMTLKEAERLLEQSRK
jgi:hypothetical protein